MIKEAEWLCTFLKIVFLKKFINVDTVSPFEEHEGKWEAENN